MERIEKLKPDAMPPGKTAADYDSAELTARRTPALMVCLSAAFAQYGKSLWAKPAVEELIRAAMACRRQWAAADARQIEDWNQVCKGASVQRRAQASTGFVSRFDADAARWRAADISVSKKKPSDGSAGLTQ
jgi:hypothetical protein